MGRLAAAFVGGFPSRDIDDHPAHDGGEDGGDASGICLIDLALIEEADHGALHEGACLYPAPGAISVEHLGCDLAHAFVHEGEDPFKSGGVA